MTVQATYDYKGVPRDTQDKFHGNQLVYLAWDQHLMFCAPHCVPLPPDMPFSALVKEVLPGMYGSHPEWQKMDWDRVEWTLNQAPFVPDMDKTLAEQGIDHKSLIRFNTPGLRGIGGVAT